MLNPVFVGMEIGKRWLGENIKKFNIFRIVDIFSYLLIGKE